MLSELLLNCLTFIVDMYEDETFRKTYTHYRSCIPRNVDVCRLRSARNAVIASSFVKDCDKCEGDMCNSSGSFAGSWGTISAVILLLVTTGFSYKF